MIGWFDGGAGASGDMLLGAFVGAGVPLEVDKKVLRGDDSSNSFAWFYFTGDKLTGVTAVNRPAEFMAGRMLIEKAATGEVTIDPARLADENIKPKEWLQ